MSSPERTHTISQLSVLEKTMSEDGTESNTDCLATPYKDFGFVLAGA